MLGSRHNVALHGGVSMNPSSFSPSLHLVYSKIGSKGRNILGNKQDNLNSSKILDLRLEMREVILDIGAVSLEYMSVRGEILLCTLANVSPRRITGRGQE